MLAFLGAFLLSLRSPEKSKMSQSSVSLSERDNGGAYELWKQEALALSSKSLHSEKKSKSIAKEGKLPGGSVERAAMAKSMSSLHPSSSLTSRRLNCCSVCSRLAFLKPNIYSAMFNYDEELFEREVGFFDIVHQVNDIAESDNRLSCRGEKYKVDRDVARVTADAAEKCVRELRLEMLERGLLQSSDQNFTGEASRARVVAPIHSDEIQLGALLGVGGFSAVLEVGSFKLDSQNGGSVAREEELSRRHLLKSVLRQPGDRKSVV